MAPAFGSPRTASPSTVRSASCGEVQYDRGSWPFCRAAAHLVAQFPVLTASPRSLGSPALPSAGRGRRCRPRPAMATYLPALVTGTVKYTIVMLICTRTAAAGAVTVQNWAVIFASSLGMTSLVSDPRPVDNNRHLAVTCCVVE